MTLMELTVEEGFGKSSAVGLPNSRALARPRNGRVARSRPLRVEWSALVNSIVGVAVAARVDGRIGWHATRSSSHALRGERVRRRSACADGRCPAMPPFP